MNKTNTTIPKERWGVHEHHCCAKHGCKYENDSNCPVVLGLTKQKYPCEMCDIEKEQGLESSNEIEELLKELKRYDEYLDKEDFNDIGSIVFSENPEGEWIKYSDLVELFKKERLNNV